MPMTNFVQSKMSIVLRLKNSGLDHWIKENKPMSRSYKTIHMTSLIFTLTKQMVDILRMQNITNRRYDSGNTALSIAVKRSRDLSILFGGIYMTGYVKSL